MNMYCLPKNEVTHGVRIPREMKERLDELAKSQNCSTSAMIRSMLYGAIYSLDHPDTIDAVKAVLANER